MTMEIVDNSGEDPAAVSELLLYPEKTKLIHIESGETVRCSDFSAKPSSSSFMDTIMSSSTEQFLVNSSNLVVAENQKLNDDLVIITAERDSLKAELTVLKMKMEEFRASAEEDEPNKKEKGNKNVPESPKSPGNNSASGGGTAGTFRSSFRLPSFMMMGGNNNDKLLDDADLDLDLDLVSVDSSIGEGSKKAPSTDSLSSPVAAGSRNNKSPKRMSLFGKIFGGTDLEHTIPEEENERPEKSGEIIVDWKRNTSKPKLSPKPGPRSEKGAESSSDVDSDISESEARDEVAEEHVVENVSKKGRRSSTRLQRLAAERRNKRESTRISKNFNLPEDEVDGLKSCLKSKQAPNTKQKVKFRQSIIEVRRVSKIRGSAWDDCFFTEEEMADFKYEAFLEECGLEDDDF